MPSPSKPKISVPVSFRRDTGLLELLTTPIIVSSMASNGPCDGSVYDLSVPSGVISSRIEQLVSAPTAGHCVNGGVAADAELASANYATPATLTATSA